MIKFEVNKTYTNNFLCDADLYFTYRIIKRTNKNVWILEIGKSVIERKKIHIMNIDTDIEYIYPMGQYSMCPVLTADKIKE